MRALLLVLRSPEGGAKPSSAGSAEPGQPSPGQPSPGLADLSQPSPGLADLATVVSGMADLGLAVETRTSGEPFALSPGAQLAVHRLVTESLANALKHGGRSRPVRLDLGFRPEALTVTVTSPLPTPGELLDTVPGSGTGLLGVRERLAAYGGTVEAGPAGVNWVVRGRLPREQQAALDTAAAAPHANADTATAPPHTPSPEQASAPSMEGSP